MRIPFLSLLLLLLLKTTHAYPPERALANLADDFAQCAAYFTLAAPILAASDRHDLAVQTTTAATRMRDMAITLSDADVTASRMQRETREMIGILAGSNDRFVLVMDRYKVLCDMLLSQPLTRWHYWLNK